MQWNSLLKQFSSSSYEENIVINYNKAFQSISYVVTLEKMRLRSKKLEDPSI